MKSKLLRTYFASYIILLVTVFIALAVIFVTLLSFSRKQMETGVLRQVEQIGLSLETQLSSYKAMAEQVHVNEYLTNYRLSNGDYMAYAGIRELRKIRSSNSLLFDVFITYRDGEVYSARGKTQEQVYALSNLHLSAESEQYLTRLFAESKGQSFHPLYKTDDINGMPDYLLCLYPLLSGTRPIGIIGFVVTGQSLTDLLGDLLLDYTLDLRVTFPNGDVLINTGVAANPEVKPQYRYTLTTEESAFTFELAVDEQLAFAPLYNVIRTGVLIILSVFGLSLWMSYEFSRRHYNPIKLLGKSISDKNNGTDLSMSANELDVITKFVDKKGHENEQLNAKVLEINALVVRQAYELLFTGAYENLDRAFGLLELAGRIFPESHYTVLCIVPLDAQHKSTALLEKAASSLCATYYHTNIVDRSAVVCIAGIKGWDAGRRFRKTVAAALVKKASFPVAVCFGRVYTEIESISRAYMESIVCAESRILKQSRTDTEFFEELMSSDEKPVWPDEEKLSDFIKAVEAGQPDKCISSLDELLEDLKNRCVSIEARRFILTDIVHRLYHTLKAAGFDANDIMDTNCESIDIFSQHVRKILRSCLVKPRENGEDIIRDVVEYIDKYYNDPQLTLQSLAETFHISQNYISSFFKTHIGESYMDYISALRLQKAAALLTDTETTIRDIVSSVGYFDTVSFTKKFKRQYGATPSEYRRAHKTIL